MMSRLPTSPAAVGQAKCTGRRLWAGLLASLAVALAAGAPARAMTINPTFTSSVTSLPNAATIESAFNYDAFNAFTNTDVKNDLSAVDLTVMDVIGYDPVPEPATLALLALGGAAILARRRRVG